MKILRVKSKKFIDVEFIKATPKGSLVIYKGEKVYLYGLKIKSQKGLKLSVRKNEIQTTI